VVTGASWQALALAVWGTVIVGLVDNVARPLLISSFSRVHLLVATLGVIGGVTAFGLIGIFVGPVILALLLCVWRAWLARVPAQDEACVREPVPALLTERAPARN
jgi:Ca2+-transporting ATPase